MHRPNFRWPTHPRQGFGSFVVTTRQSSNRANKAFSDPRSAELIGEARSIESELPKLHGLPEIVVTGRANVGKSSLLNATLGRVGLVETSSKAGKTRTLKFYRVGPPPGSLALVDAPGYGARGRPEWGNLFAHYLETRKELKRVYVLINAKHGLSEDDKFMLQDLDRKCQSSEGQTFTLQSIITKVDLLLTERETDGGGKVKKIQQEIFEAAPTCLPPILTSTTLRPHLGIVQLRRSIVEACGVGRVKINALH